MDQTSESEKQYQGQIYEDIKERLINAGYFRARISNLSDFDRVVGGLCWCITSSGADVDVDILFQENSSIGQKIVLSEAVTKALRKMGCPHPLQPHQIQGGVGGADYAAIREVIVWLIVKYFERRNEKDEQFRNASHYQFSKSFRLSLESDSHQHHGISPALVRILSCDRAVKQYKRKSAATDVSLDSRVRACLLEYGETMVNRVASSERVGLQSDHVNCLPAETIIGELSGRILAEQVALAGKARMQVAIPNREDVQSALANLTKADTTELNAFEKQLAKVVKETKREEEMLAQQICIEQEALLQHMLEIEEGRPAAVSGAHVGDIIGLGSSELGSAAAVYKLEVEEAQKSLSDSKLFGGSKIGQIASFNRQKRKLCKLRDEWRAKEKELSILAEVTNEKAKILAEESDSAAVYCTQLKAQLKKLADLEEAAGNNSQDIADLQQQVLLQEKLLSQEVSFKASCTATLSELQDEIAALDDSLKLSGIDAAREQISDEDRKMLEIEDAHAKVLAKHSRVKQVLADANLEVSTILRTIDDIPTRTELIQYERRFDELYKQIQWKLEETRKYYDMYNILDTTLTFIQKEVKLLNSISENLGEAMRSAQSRAEFSHQFESIVRGVEDSLRRQENLLAQKSARVEELKVTHQNLVDQQRKYFSAVKDFQVECNKNEWLNSKLESSDSLQAT